MYWLMALYSGKTAEQLSYGLNNLARFGIRRTKIKITTFSWFLKSHAKSIGYQDLFQSQILKFQKTCYMTSWLWVKWKSSQKIVNSKWSELNEKRMSFCPITFSETCHIIDVVSNYTSIYRKSVELFYFLYILYKLEVSTHKNRNLYGYADFNFLYYYKLSNIYI